jgi:hypothetical protein
MGPDELLFWLSARREGSWHQFRSSVEEIVAADDERGDSLPVYQKIRFGLEQLGHVEFASRGREGGWRVAPPVLAVSRQQNGFVGIACGARTPGLMRRLQEQAGTRLDISTKGIYPSVARLVSPEAESLSRIASDAGFEFQLDTPVRLASCMPRIDRLPGSKPAALPFGRDFEVARFALERRHCKWMPSSDAEAARNREGLYRFVRFQTPEYFLKIGNRVLKVDGQTGKFFLLAIRGRQVLRYDRSKDVLRVPAICHPPLLVDRALVLCTGYLPEYDRASRMLVYTGIPEEVAGLAASILLQGKI